MLLTRSDQNPEPLIDLLYGGLNGRLVRINGTDLVVVASAGTQIWVQTPNNDREIDPDGEARCVLVGDIDSLHVY